MPIPYVYDESDDESGRMVEEDQLQLDNIRDIPFAARASTGDPALGRRPVAQYIYLASWSSSFCFVFES